MQEMAFLGFVRYKLLLWKVKKTALAVRDSNVVCNDLDHTYVV